MNGRISKIIKNAARKASRNLVQEKLTMPDGSIRYTGFKRMYREFKKGYHNIERSQFIKEMRSL